MHHYLLYSCDNVFGTGEGQRAMVQLESASGTQSHPTPGELADATAQNHIKFEDINPMTYVTEEITVRNLT